MNGDKLFSKAIKSIEVHNRFLENTKRNLNYLRWGTEITTLSKVELTAEPATLSDILATEANPYNPVARYVSVLLEEMENSSLTVRVFPPEDLAVQEPYVSIAARLENVLRSSLVNKPLGLHLLDVLTRNYSVVGFEGKEIFRIPPANFVPGDYAIENISDQPYVIRITYPRKIHLVQLLQNPKTKKKELEEVLKTCDDLDSVKIYDIRSKDLRKRRIYLADGTLIFEDTLEKPYEYPYGLVRDPRFAEDFYGTPLVSKLIPLLKKNAEISRIIENSAKGTSRPVLTYDIEARIDSNKFHRELVEGKRHILLGKSASGHLEYLTPPRIPSYVFDFRNSLLQDILVDIGISPLQLGSKIGGIRGSGAVEHLLEAGFRSFKFYGKLIAQAYTQVANYFLDYLVTHYLRFLPQLRLKENEIKLLRDSKFKARVKVSNPLLSKSYKEQSMILRKKSEGLISEKQALEELEYDYPERIQAEKRKEIQETLALKKIMSEPVLSIEDKIRARLSKALDYVPEIKSIGKDLFEIKVRPKDVELVNFVLSDFKDKILIREQEIKKVKVKKIKPQVKTNLKISKTISSESQESESVSEAQKVKSEVKSKTQALSEKTESKSQKTKKPVSKADYIRRLVKVFQSNKVIKKNKVSKYLSKYPGLYLVEPHALNIYKKEKKLIIKSKLFDIVKSPHILAGQYLYGVIIPQKIIQISDKTFKELADLHLISQKEKNKWWAKKPLYAYVFKFYKFEEPVEYVRKPGIQTFIKAPIELRKETKGSPYTGDLKPIKIELFKRIPPAKPEKKAYQPYELFDPKRLKEILPEGTYNVSEKIDGVRCFVHKKGNDVRLFSDQGKEFDKQRVAPVIESVKKKFKEDVILDGELVLEGGIHQDVAGYLHSKGKPDPKELKRIYYYVWDILYLNGKPLASKPFIQRWDILNLRLKSGEKFGHLIRVRNKNVDRNLIPKVFKDLTSSEGIVVRDINAAYWACHTLYKVKKLAEIDVKVFAVEKTKTGLPIFHCLLRDGTYIGQTYAQSEVKAKPGDVIRVQVEHFTLKPDGSLGWYAPRPSGVKGGVKKYPSLTQKGIGGPDTLSFVKEHYLLEGSEKKWNEWLKVHKVWKKEVMPKLLKRIKEKIEKGVEASKT